MDNLKMFRDYLCNVGQTECIDQPLWDTVVYPAGGINILHCFAVPFGTNNKSDEDTNMMVPSGLPMPQAYFVESFALSVMEDSIPYQVLQTGMFEFIIGSKIYFRFGPLISMFTLPDGLRNTCLPLKTGLGIVGGMNFAASLIWRNPPRLKKDTKIRVQLNGSLFRPVV